MRGTGFTWPGSNFANSPNFSPHNFQNTNGHRTRWKPREQRLAFDSYSRPGAYSDGGHTDGAILPVEWADLDGTTRVLYKRELNPAAAPPDGHRQRLNLRLPNSAPGQRLTLQPDPGPAGNLSRDWIHVENLTPK